MNGQGSRRPIQPAARRIYADVVPHRPAASTLPALHPQQRSAAAAAHAGETGKTILQHLGRMLATAGQSWAVGEHDTLIKPLYRIRKYTYRYLPRHVQKWQLMYFAMLVVALAAIPAGLLVRNQLNAQRYVLSNATKKLVGEPVTLLDKKVSFDSKEQRYRYNPEASNGLKQPTNGGDNGLRIGGSDYYGVDLAKEAAAGQTFTDAQTKLSFSLVSQFGQLDGKHIDGHIVYPFDKGQVVYSLKANGLKEDIVVAEPTDSVSLSYKLNLPDSLEARLNTDGSVGIYSADPKLFGNISYGSDKDLQAVEQARQNSKKTNLVFTIPAPVVVESNKQSGKGQAKFTLEGDMLTVQAINLTNLNYPISIDPSVIVNSANSFLLGNNEDNSALITASSVARGALTGGSASAGWSNAISGANNIAAFDSGQEFVMNGYIYYVGGTSATGTESTVIYWAPIGSNGIIGQSTNGWQSTNVTYPAGAKLGSYSEFAAYNGFIYYLGGRDGTTLNVQQYQYMIKPDPITGTPPSTWTTIVTGTTFTARSGTAAVAYNGFLYVIGGCTGRPGIAPAGCNVITNDAWSAPINADGTLGNWTSANLGTMVSGSTVFSARQMHDAVVYNGNVYVAGGCSITTNNCTPINAEVWHAPLTSNGKIGTWVQDSSMLFAKGGLQDLVIQNGYIYSVGGCTGSNCAGTPVTDAEYAPIYANGSLGPWSATSTSSSGGTVTRYAQAMVAYNGYLYMSGGCPRSGTNCAGPDENTSISAPIDSVGTVGQYSTATSMASAKYGVASVATMGYIYLIGGDGSNGVDGTESTVIQFAHINSDGTLGSWANMSTGSGPNIVGGRFGAAAAAYNGYVYVSGGSNSSSGATGALCSDVQFAKVNPTDGTFSTAWLDAVSGGGAACTNSDMLVGQPSGTAGRYYHQMLTYNNHLYILGGENNGNNAALQDVQFATINSNGTISALHYTHNSTDDNTTYVSGMSTVRVAFGAVVANGYIYAAGGRNVAALANNLSSIESAKINSDGTVASWDASAGTMPGGTARSMFGMVVSNDFVYITGGYHAVADTACNTSSNRLCNDTNYAPICNGTNTTGGCSAAAPGKLGTWVSTSTISSRANNFAVGYNGYLYTGGGSSTGGNMSQFVCRSLGSCTILTDVQYAPLNNGGGGNSVTWNSTTNMPASLGAHGSVALNGYLYVIGGCTALLCLGNPTASVYHTTINSDGTLNATWTTDTSLAQGKAAFGLTTYNGAIYIAGGTVGSNGTYDNKAYYALPDKSTGNITAWTQASSFTVARNYPSVFAYKGRLYITGGGLLSANTSCNTISSTLCNDVQFAPINGDGSLGSWQYTYNGAATAGYVNGFTTGRENHISLANNGYAYIVGGFDANTSNVYNDVQYAPINADGTIGTWTPTTYMLKPRYTSVGTIYNGYLYVYGGATTGAATIGDVSYAPILSNGSIGNWTISAIAMPTTSAQNSYSGGALANGYIYYLGGQGGGSVQNSVQYAPLQVIPRVAHYSRLIDLASTVNGNTGGNVQLTRYLVKNNGSIISQTSACISVATAGNVALGTATCGMPKDIGTPGTITKSFARYAFIYLTIDDSQAAMFSDTQSVTNEIDVFFHAANNRRLRGGQTFTDMGITGGTNNQLDTEGP